MGRFLTYLLMAVIALFVVFYFYQKKIPAVPVVAGDLDKGGMFTDGERTTLVSACSKFIKKDPDKVCGCIADKVTTEFSHFDRMVMTAAFQEKLSDIVGLTKGLIASGIPPEQVKAAEDGSRVRIAEMRKACGASD